MSPEAVLAVAYGIFTLPVVAAGVCLRTQWLARRRNRAESCGRCGGVLYAPNTGEGPSLVQGHLYCSPCATHLRTRTRVALSLAGGHVALLAVAAGVGAATDGATVLLMGGAAVAQTAAMAGGAVYLMRRGNQRAMRELESRGEVLPRLTP